jgi:PmbA protein
MSRAAETVRKLAPGGAWFDIYESGGESFSIRYANSRFHSVTLKENSGTGVRINLNGKTGFSYSNSPGGIETAAALAVENSKYGDTESFQLPGPCAAAFEPYNSSGPGREQAQLMTEAEELISAIRTGYPAVSVDVSVSRAEGISRLTNSSGFDSSYRNSVFSASSGVTMVMADDSKLDVYESFASIKRQPLKRMGERLLQYLEWGSRTHQCRGGSLPVIFTPRAFSQLLSVLLSGLNGKPVHRGISPFAGRLGEQLFSERFSLINNPLLPESPYSYPFDDEGVPASAFPLIEKGVVKNFYVDLKHAALLNIKPTGGASRGYSSLPGPSLSNLSVQPGSSPLADMMKETPYGILADRFIGFGQTNTLEGEFTANMGLAFCVENGEVTGRVKNAMISGNVFELLKGESVFSIETETTGSMILPWVLFPSVAVAV